MNAKNARNALQLWRLNLFTGNFKSFEKKVWLATPTPHPEMMEYIQKAYDDNW